MFIVCVISCFLFLFFVLVASHFCHLTTFSKSFFKIDFKKQSYVKGTVNNTKRYQKPNYFIALSFQECNHFNRTFPSLDCPTLTFLLEPPLKKEIK